MSSRRSFAAASVILVSALALTSCATEKEPAEDATDASDADTISYSWERNVAGEDEEPEFVTETVDVPKNPETIVAFEMSTVDTIGALGGKVAGTPLESVPDYLEDALAEDAFNAGTLFEADLIEIEAQQPDLIIIGGRSSALFDDLNEIAPTIDLGITGSYLETLERNVDLLGQVLGAEDEAEAALNEVEAGIDEAKEAVSAEGTGLGLMVSGGELNALAPAPENASSPQVRGGLLYDVFGVNPVVEDIEASTHGEPVSFEYLLENDPDNLWVIDRDAAIGEAAAAAEVLDNDIVAKTTAAKNDHILYLDPTAWYIVYGGLETTQILIDDVMQIAE